MGNPANRLLWGEIGFEIVDGRPPEDWLPLMEDVIHRCTEDPEIGIPPYTAQELVKAIDDWRYIVKRLPRLLSTAG